MRKAWKRWCKAHRLSRRLNNEIHASSQRKCWWSHMLLVDNLSCWWSLPRLLPRPESSFTNHVDQVHKGTSTRRCLILQRHQNLCSSECLELESRSHTAFLATLLLNGLIPNPKILRGWNIRHVQLQLLQLQCWLRRLQSLIPRILMNLSSALWQDKLS